jgi:UTP:GlnB (protein PII) uridylyltransferase
MKLSKINWNSKYISRDVHNQTYNSIIINSHWKNLSVYTDSLRMNDVNITKAYIKKNKTILIVNDLNGKYIPEEKQLQINNSLYENLINNEPISLEPRFSLAPDTDIQTYDIPFENTTVLEFYCKDQIGLLTDICEVLSWFPYEIVHAYISTKQNYAHNIIAMQNKEKCLNEYDVQYLRNVFDYEIKNTTKFIKQNSY